MATPAALAATSLPNGKVLVLQSAGAQLYDPKKGTWSSSGPWTNPGAALLTLNLLANGKVLGLGATAELYNPVTNTWAKAPKPETAHGEGFTATSLPDGKVLVVGGLGDTLGTAAADIYDPASNMWARTRPMNDLRYEHTAVLLSNGKVLVAGGWSQNYGPKRSSVELYDPKTRSWSPTASLPYAPVRARAVRLADDKVLLAGGTSGPDNAGGSNVAVVYDVERKAWSATGSMATARDEFSATALGDGRVLVAGGRDPSVQPVATAEVYNDETASWLPAAPMEAPRAQHIAALLPSGPRSVCGDNCGKILVAGGTAGPTAELYSPTTEVRAPAPAGPRQGTTPKDVGNENNGSPLGLIVSIAILALSIGAAAFALARRRRIAPRR